MIFGEKADRVAAFFVSILGATAIAIAIVFAASHAQIAHAVSSANIEIDALMRKLSEVRTAGGKFTEHKYFSILDEPMILKGTVRYRAPDYVRKEYHDPDSESYEVRGDNLTIEYPDGRRRDLSIDEHPVLRAFVESYRSTLAGDLETLRRYFKLELGGSMDAWQLRLTPRSSELAERLRAVVMRGREGTVTSVETLEASGDRSVMTLESSGE
jgi:hypothetical protein